MEKCVNKDVIKGIILSNRGIKRIRSAIWVLLIIILLGSLIIWIIKPTITFQSVLLPRIRAKVETTSFGTQGPALLIHTSPVLLFAILGCIYLHLGTKLDDQEDFNRKSKLYKYQKALRRIAIVGWPLGIVSWIEIMFLMMFFALLVWSFSNYLHIDYTKLITPQTLAQRNETLWEAKVGWTSLSLGSIGNIGLALLFFPVTRRSSILPLFGLTSEASIKYHIWLGHITMLIFTAHGLGYIYYWAITHRLLERHFLRSSSYNPQMMVRWANTRASNIAGELSLLSGLILWATTITRCRRRFFEIFFFAHHLYIPFLIFFAFHLGYDYASIMLPGFYLFIIDRFLRFIQSRRRVRLLHARLLPCDCVELTFSKAPDLVYAPTSIVFVNVPSISKLQWHPYTVTSSGRLETEQLSVVVKSEGYWSQKLCEILSSSPDRLPIAIEGPYGHVSINFLRHDVLMMVSGGSGITPFISIIREIIFSSTTMQSPKLLLISAFKTTAGITMLDLLLPISGHRSINPNAEIQIEAYVTREKESITEETPKVTQKLSFTENPSDEPISGVLGPNGWLSIGAIIGSSFVLYLISIGILTRFYVFTMDYNTFEIFSLSGIAALNMALMFVSVAVVATCWVLWRRKRRAMKAKSLCCREPEMGPFLLELESFPQQSLAQCTKVHYGERPDLKKMMEECRGCSVGVMVCGPQKMRHEVAAICSSSSADNLHFESISFSW